MVVNIRHYLLLNTKTPGATCVCIFVFIETRKSSFELVGSLLLSSVVMRHRLLVPPSTRASWLWCSAAPWRVGCQQYVAHPPPLQPQNRAFLNAALLTKNMHYNCLYMLSFTALAGDQVLPLRQGKRGLSNSFLTVFAISVYQHCPFTRSLCPAATSSSSPLLHRAGAE